MENCRINPSVQSKLFDHKAVVLDFTKRKPVTSRPNISSKILKDPDLDIVVRLASYECYVLNSVNDLDKNRLLNAIGTGFALSRSAGPDPLNPSYMHANLVDLNEREPLIANLREIVRQLEDSGIEERELVVDDDIFLELLINHIRNEVINYQAFIFKKIDESTTRLTDKIKNLKLDHKNNFDKISELELQLRQINETKINCELEKNPNFALLNSERITPFFLKMAKGCTQESSLDGVCDYDGRPFNNTRDQREFIYTHFADSFKKNPLEPDSLEGYIENFLGVDILNHPIVRNLKLSEDERTRLDGPISEFELDSAIEGANANSAAGIDGINTAFIKRYWHIFKVPQLKYAAKAFEKKELTHSFKTAIIKLIPKKGDGRNIKKWRPISLLSCMYKILSRVVNNRLKSVINRFTSRAQKGFTNHRYIQEVLINACEKISHCNNSNIGGALLSVDQSRAFDTISHKYMEQVFRFFGFGPEFISIMNTIGTGRNGKYYL